MLSFAAFEAATFFPVPLFVKKREKSRDLNEKVFSGLKVTRSATKGNAKRPKKGKANVLRERQG